MVNGSVRNCVFTHWSANGAELQNPYSLESAINFTQNNAKVIANFKGIHLTNGSFSNNQKNFISAREHLYLVYHSMGRIWLEKSSDGGTIWQFLNNIKPLDNQGGLFPSVYTCGDDGNYSNAFYIVYQAVGDYGLEIKMQFWQNDEKKCDLTVQEEYSPDFNFGLSPAVDQTSKPVIYKNRSRILIVWNAQNKLYYKYGQLLGNMQMLWYNEVPIEIAQIQGAIPPNQSITGDDTDDFHLTWQDNGTIKYCRFVPNSAANALTISNSATISSGCGFPLNIQPSITSINGYPAVTWIGTPYYQSTYRSVIVRKKTASGWGSSFTQLGSQARYPVIEGYENETIVAYEENNGATDKYYRNGVIKSLGISGNLQLLTCDDKTKAKAISIKYGDICIEQKNDLIPASTTPVKPPVSLDKSNTNMHSGKKLVLRRNNKEYFYAIGDIKANGMNIFGTEIESEKEYIPATDKFVLKSGDSFTFRTDFGSYDTLSGGENIIEPIRIVVALMDSKNKTVISEFITNEMNSTNLDSENNTEYNIDTKECDGREVYLALKITEKEKYIISSVDIIDDSEVLAKKNMKQKTIEIKNDLSVKEYGLSQNYPNPFNPRTLIKYQVPKVSRVTLKVYDVLGKEIATLVNDIKQKGRYEIKFNASNLASGVYIYTIRANDYVSSKKMLLIK